MSVPDKLVRFYGSVDYALDCIETDDLTFPHVNTFNDPFDPPKSLLFEHKEQFDLFNKWLHDSGNISLLEGFKEEHFNNDMRVFKDLFDELRQKSFAVCLSGNDLLNEDKKIKENSLYMWGHYASGHKGVAIEFNTERLKKEKFGSKIFSVNYNPSTVEAENKDFFYLRLAVDKLPEDNQAKIQFRESREKIKETWEKTLFTKSLNWNPENEWRIYTEDDKTSLPYTKIKMIHKPISAVYLGVRTNPKDKERIRKQIKREQIQARLFEGDMSKEGLFVTYKEITNL